MVALAVGVVLAIRGDDPTISGAGVAELLLATALGEEVLFRVAILVLAHRVWAVVPAHLLAAASFGCWHLGNALVGSQGSAPGARAAYVAGTVVVTAASALVFTWPSSPAARGAEWGRGPDPAEGGAEREGVGAAERRVVPVLATATDL